MLQVSTKYTAQFMRCKRLHTSSTETQCSLFLYYGFFTSNWIVFGKTIRIKFQLDFVQRNVGQKLQSVCGNECQLISASGKANWLLLPGGSMIASNLNQATFIDVQLWVCVHRQRRRCIFLADPHVIIERQLSALSKRSHRRQQRYLVARLADIWINHGVRT